MALTEKFSYEDKILMIGFRKFVNPNGEQCGQIYEMYKKYIRADAPMYTTGCSCEYDISNYYWKLMDWFHYNEKEFKGE